jgi:hypothetical protein
MGLGRQVLERDVPAVKDALVHGPGAGESAAGVFR